MYGRAPRVLHPPNRSTVEHVGPGTYDLPDRKKAEGAAPFSCLAPRETFLDISEQTTLAPGPAHYNNNVRVGEAKSLAGHSVMASQTQRFQSAATLAPGPGAYGIPANLKGKSLNRTYPPGAGAADTEDRQRTNLHPEKLNLKYEKKATVPSIPAAGQALGYDESDSGELHAQPRPDYDMSLGPAYYSVNDKPTQPTEKYRGINFSKRTSRRFQNVRTDSVPPPGYYNVEPRKRERPATAGPGGDKKNMVNPVSGEKSDNVRYHQLVEKQQTKRNIPGPGAYNIGTELGAKNGATGSTANVPFGGYSTRFAHQKSHGPPVGSYEDPRTSLQVVKRVTGTNKNPFGQGTARFKQERPSRMPPAPSTYNVDIGTSIVDDCLRKATVGRHGAFGALSTRTTDMGGKEQEQMPGPAHYQPNLSSDAMSPPQGSGELQAGGSNARAAARYKKPTAQFASSTRRLDELQRRGKEAPAPGTYNVSQSYEASFGHQTKAKPTTMDAAARQRSFMTMQRRFDETGLQKRTGDPKNPEPGRYTTEKHNATGSNLKNSKMVTTTQRFSEQPSNVPGPGSYEFPASVTHTVLKGTHNSTLNNPLVGDQAGPGKRAARARFCVGPI